MAASALPASPLLKKETLIDSYKQFVGRDLSSLIPIVKFSYPIQRALKVGQDSKLKMRESEYLNSRSQDLKDFFHDAGQFYWFNSDNLKIEKSLFMKNSGAFILDELQVQDIDNLSDWLVAECKFKVIANKK